MRTLGARLAALIPGFPDCRLCVALSGGVDSVVLLTAVATLPRSTRPRHLRALHVDHHLRPESALWRAHALRTARQLRVSCTVLDAEVNRARGTSLEAEARRARYALLAGALRDGETLVTAQHLDDQAETLLLQLLRGAGVAGLAAMPERAPLGRGWLVRPLLRVTRAGIERWARERQLAWVEDDSNVDERFDRNFLRRRVLPLLRERWPAAPEAIARAAGHLAEAQQLLDRLAVRDLEHASDGEALSAMALRALDPARRRNALRAWLRSRALPLPDTARLTEMAGTLLAARPGAVPRVEWDGASVERQGERVIAAARECQALPSPGPAPGLTWHWRRRRTLALPGGGRLCLRADAHGDLDLGRLPHPLELRFRRGGEKLLLRRDGGGRRAVKALLREARLTPAERAHVPLLFAADRLLAVGDLHLDAGVRADAGSVRRARLVWERCAPVR